MQLGPLAAAVETATAEAMDLVPRIWDRDHTVWGEDPTEIADRLGWLDAPDRADAVADDLRAAADEVIRDGITDVLLVGMGGSSLYPEVLATTFGPQDGAPRLHVLDSTDPGAVLAVEAALPWDRTLVVPASKSGTTIEMACHLERFLVRLREAHGDDAGRFVTPITDPGSELDQRATAEGFRRVFHGQPDVGGRFSALTPFGLWPAALLGLDVRTHVAAARQELGAARSTDPDENLPATLGAVMAAGVREGRDKLTIVLPAEVATFGLWIEQLVAESTGKHGVGILPVIDEDPSQVHLGDDRLVVVLGDNARAATIAREGAPVASLPWNGPLDLGREVVRWEFATAVAGGLLGINPFDQPDVQAAKTATSKVLSSGKDLPPTSDAREVLEQVGPGDYVGLLAFVTPGSDDERRVRAVADALRQRLKVPVTVGIGPRYLHSTGQLHKGGPDRGAFLVTVGDDPVDAEVPGRDLTFSRLKRAQAAGDFSALSDAGRRVALVSLDDLAGE
jgi:transaldolase / glucose-6-phosphate isomerase